jgi:S1-C subfamily serine protease
MEGGTGSGAILDKQGHIVTNFHVSENANGIEVTLSDKSRHPARVIGADQNNDLAVIKIDVPADKLTPIPLGTSAGLQVGQKVLAIGNPYGLERTLTTGIISSLGRSIEARTGRIIDDIIQTDAAINPGNSGGPLLNSAGEIIGINTAIVSARGGGSVGIGFAIPVETVKQISGDLITLGYVRYPYLGISSRGALNLLDYPGLAQALQIQTDRGLLILALEADSPAGNSGIRAGTRRVRVGNSIIPAGGDVILAIQGTEVASVAHLADMVEKFKPGDRVTLKILRENRQMDIPVVLGELRVQ